MQLVSVPRLPCRDHWHYSPLLLLFLWVSLHGYVHAVIQTDTYYNVPNGACIDTIGVSYEVNVYNSYRGPLTLPEVDLVTGMINSYYPNSSTLEYSTEGVRFIDPRCGFCPYSGPYEPSVRPEYLMSGGVRFSPDPMYGPCFDGKTSVRLNCVQNQLLYPPGFVGEYFYPNQDPDVFSGFPYFFHDFIEGDTPTSITNINTDGTPRAPTNYALGRGNVRLNLASFQIIQMSTGLINASLTAIIQAPYATNAGPVPNALEGWPKWAQHFCRPACHRDALLQLYEIKPADYAQQPVFSYLARRVYSTKTPGSTDPLQVIRCVRCPPFHTAYTWGLVNTSQDAYEYDADMPRDPRMILISTNCYPWFGSVPLLMPYMGNASSPTAPLPMYIFANVTTVNHGTTIDGVLRPSYHKEYLATPCPVNTYNDRCAHYHKLKTIETQESPYPGMPPMQQPQCTPCPPGGFHTDGLRGAWFCLPPPGQTAIIHPIEGDPTASSSRGLLTLFVDARNMSTMWARRDVLGFQWECGLTSQHCHQCRDQAGMEGKLPHEFNEEMILKHLFVWQDCPSRYYCPTALREAPTQCPSDFPWSPRGSSSRRNCTCSRGRYLDAVTRTCVLCKQPTSCSNGQYLAGTTLCTQADGATSGGVCTPCTNAPSGATYVEGVGIEALALTGSYQGVCSFNCPSQTVISGAGTCLSTYTCRPAPSPRDLEQRQIYSGLLAPPLGDGFRVLEVCRMQRNLSSILDTAISTRQEGSTLWLLTASTCAEASPGVCGPAGTVCVVTTNATYFRNHICAVCPPPPPYGYYDVASMRATLAFTCKVQCDPGFYHNTTSLRCSSCTALDSICGDASLGMHVRGGGCYGSAAPFVSMNNLKLLKEAHCIQCTKDVLPPGSSRYLETSGPNGCYYADCATSADVSNGLAYILTPCGGTSNFITALCTTECEPGFYLHGACTQTTTGVCRPCTVSKPGHYRTGLCGVADSVFQQCGVPSQGGVFVPGFYCPGSTTASLACPHNKTSMQYASDAASHCFCPAGTQLSLLNDGTCVPMRCPGDILSPSAPGAGWRSSMYMTSEASMGAFVSVCRPCSDPSSNVRPAFSLGDGLHLTSCQCPPGSYAMLDTADTTRITCSLCPQAGSAALSCVSSGNVGHYTTAPSNCWSGLTSGLPACQCLLPPFTNGDTAPGTNGPGSLLLTQCEPTADMCALGFLLAPDFARGGLYGDGGPVPAQRPTGSPLYITQTHSVLGWAKAHSTAANPTNPDFDYTIARLTTTSDYATWGDIDNLQYVLWLIAEPRSTNVYAVPLPPNSLGSYDPYSSADVWNVIPDGMDTYCTVEDLAVAQWILPQTPARLSPSAGSGMQPFSGNTDAAVAVTDHTLFNAGTSLFLYLNTFSVNLLSIPSGAIAWDTPAGQRIHLTPFLNVSVVAMAHAYTPPGGRAAGTSILSGSTFFVAYNVPPLPDAQRMLPSCEIVAVAVRGGNSLRTVTPGSDSQNGGALSIRSMALLPSPSDDGVYLYLALSGPSVSEFAIQLVKWTTATPLTETAQLPTPIDELFFPTTGQDARRWGSAAPIIRSLSILWQSTGLAPVFFALVEEPVTDASTAQAILYKNTGPPLTLYAADFVQRTFVPLQDMPYRTRPSLIAAYGTDLGAAALIASGGSTIFALRASRCGGGTPTGSSNADSDGQVQPHYWDGGQCLPHACIRARSCNTDQGQTWHGRLLRCVCVPGFFQVAAPTSFANLVCQACAPDTNGNAAAGFYCPGNGTRSSCPQTMTSPVRATAISDCLCRPGEFYSGVRCSACPVGQWCPNQWDALPCPGAADLSRSNAGSSYPITCVCSPGSMGVACLPCPSGYYCPSSSTMTVTNNALRLTLKPYGGASDTIIDADRACATLLAVLAEFFRTGSNSLWYLRDATTLAQRVVCIVVQPPPRRSGSIHHIAVLMVQTENGHFGNSIITSLPGLLLRLPNATAAAGGFTIESVEPPTTPLYFSVPNNTALLCPLGKTTAPGLITCICAPGYASYGTGSNNCVPCRSGDYKVGIGPGTCIACPIGTTSPAAASACLGAKPQNTTGDTADNGEGGAAGAELNIPLIAGGVAGGVVVVGTLVYALVAFAG
jgi:hypothetical protein